MTFPHHFTFIDLFTVLTRLTDLLSKPGLYGGPRAYDGVGRDRAEVAAICTKLRRWLKIPNDGGTSL